MTQPLVTAVAPRWEVDLAAALSRSAQVRVVRRCADVAELVGVVSAGVGRVAVVSSDLRGLDRTVVDTLTAQDVLVLGVHPPGDEAAERLLRRWGVRVTAPADVGAAELDRVVAQLLGPPDDPADQDGRVPGPGPEGRPPATAAPAGRPQGPARRSPDVPDGRAGPSQPIGRAGGAAEVPAEASDRRPSDLAAGDDGQLDRPASTSVKERREGPPAAGPDDRQPDGGHDDGDRREAGEIVVVWGPVGSSGRSTVAANLAAELADPSSPVLLVDADTYGASQAQLLAVLDEVPGVAAAARAADQGTLDRDVLARLAPEVRPGLRVLTGLPRADRWPELRDVALADVLEECRRSARWTVVDVAPPLEQDEELSFDTLAPRRNGAALTALGAADRVVVVGTGDPVGLQRLVRGLDELGGHSVAPRSVVVTRVRSGPVGPDPGRRIQETLTRFAGTGPVHLVPEDRDGLDAALLHGRVLAEVRPRSAARTALVELADVVAGREPRSRRERASGRTRGWLGRRFAPA